MLTVTKPYRLARSTAELLSIEADLWSAFPWLRHVFADSAYAGHKLQNALTKLGNWTIEIVKQSDAAKGFVLLPGRWVVERTVAWLNRNRRLAKDLRPASKAPRPGSISPVLD